MPWLERKTPNSQVRLPGGPGKLLTTIRIWPRCSDSDAFPGHAERKASHTLAFPLDRVDHAGAALEQDLPGNPLEPDLGVGVMRQW